MNFQLLNCRVKKTPYCFVLLLYSPFNRLTDFYRLEFYAQLAHSLPLLQEQKHWEWSRSSRDLS